MATIFYEYRAHVVSDDAASVPQLRWPRQKQTLGRWREGWPAPNDRSPRFCENPSVAVRLWRTFFLAIIGVALASCATQPAYQRPDIAIIPKWANADLPIPTAPSTPVTKIEADWWLQLNDRAIDEMVRAALKDNPTLAQALAAVDAARANASFNNAQRLPQIGVSATAARAQIPNPLPVAAPFTILENSQSLGPRLSWELDLWGRLQQSALAAQDRLDARTADAEQTRLVLIAQISDGVLGLRACKYALLVRDRDLNSRQLELELMVKRRIAGNVAPVDEASAIADLANARTARISQQEACDRNVDALVALSGLGAIAVRALVTTAPTDEIESVDSPILSLADGGGIPTPPSSQLAVPASILLHHPAVVSAEREAAARWSEIAVARADRLPRIDLGAALSGNWLQAFGESVSFQTWSLDGTLSAPLFDGGAGAARVAGSQALYRQAVANLQAAVREAAQNVEDALAAQASAIGRLETSRQAVEAGQRRLRAKEAQWRAGAINLFELEDARRTFNNAQQDAVSAARDRAQAWVDLIRASGGGTDGSIPTAESFNTFLGKQHG